MFEFYPIFWGLFHDLSPQTKSWLGKQIIDRDLDALEGSSQ